MADKVEGAAEQFEGWASDVPQSGERKKRTGATKGQIDRWRKEMVVMRGSGNWEGAKPVHVVALYAHAHEQVYGVPPAELAGQEYMRAAAFASRLLKDSFSGDVDAMVGFVAWTWFERAGGKNERAMHAWRVREGRALYRVGWPLQFGGKLLTDWRLEQLHRKVG